MKSPEAMASGIGVINLRFNQDQGLLRSWNVAWSLTLYCLIKARQLDSI